MDKTLNRILSLLPCNADGTIKHGERAKFAKSLGLKSGNVIADWVSGRSSSYFDYLYTIAALYNVPVEWLRGETDEKQPAEAEPAILSKYNALDDHGRRLVDLILNAEWERCTKTAPLPLGIED